MLQKELIFFPRIATKRLKSNWTQPDGYDTAIKVYNCIVRKKVPFVVKNKNYVTWYTCGPTVYDSAHVGHASCYVKLDLVQRILRRRFGLNIVSVMNITDIDDKIINRSNLLSVPCKEVSERYENEFWEDLKSLNVTKPDIVLRVTDNIAVIKDYVRKLLSDKKAYVADDGSVYFDLKRYESYGKLQNIGTDDKSGDFALWKGGKRGEPSWEAEWGPGRPGWHIECSAMASGVFGSNIDVHAGGIDLRFPHHENEEAQSCSYFGTNQWVNYWLHTGHLHLASDEKMSKSLKNTISIREFSETTDPDVFRMACLASHYRANMEFTSELLKTAETNLKKVKTFLNDCKSYVDGYHPAADINETELLQLISQTDSQLTEAFKDDFSTAKMMKALIALITYVNKALSTHSTSSEINYLNNSGPIAVVSVFVQNQMDALGFTTLKKEYGTDGDIETVMDVLSSFRQSVRQHALGSKNKDLLKFCDEARDKLKECKIHVRDFGKGSLWNKL